MERQKVSNILSVFLYSCLSYPAYKAHAPYFIVIHAACLALQYFSTWFHESMILDKVTEHKIYVLIFSIIFV
jgi:hypothetical protein